VVRLGSLPYSGLPQWQLASQQAGPLFGSYKEVVPELQDRREARLHRQQFLWQHVERFPRHGLRCWLQSWNCVTALTIISNSHVQA